MTNTNDKFYVIYEKYKNMVLKLAFDMTKDYYYAQDICQETFIKLYGYQNNLDERKVKNWLMVVAANLIRDYWRRGGKYKEVLGDPKEMLNAGCQEKENCIDAYLDELGQKELRNRVLDGLRKCNADWYEVFILVEYLEVPRKIVAQRRGIALSTVDSYLKKSRKWMRNQYGKEYEEM